MWGTLGTWIVRYRIVLLILVLLTSAGMGYVGRKVKISNEFNKVIPPDDPDLTQYEKFKQTFGEDSNTLIVGLEADNLFDYKLLNGLWLLSQDLKKREGVTQVVNLTETFSLEVDQEAERFVTRRIMTGPLANQAEADSLKARLLALPFYQRLLLNKKNNASLVAINLSQALMTSDRRHPVIYGIKASFDSLASQHKAKAYTSGLPYVRTYVATQMPKELRLFMGLSILLTAISLFLFYRSLYAVIIPLVLVGLATATTFGITGLLGYDFTVLSGLLPPIIVILSIPPSIYMLSDYHEEYKRLRNKEESIRMVVRKLGLVTLMINANTAFGFLTLYFTEVTVLQEFGLIAFLATMAAFLLTIIILPGLYSLLPAPTEGRLRHLDWPWMKRLVDQSVNVVETKGKLIYSATAVLLLVSAFGISKVVPVAFMIDDFPHRDGLYESLHFVEREFGGICPFEIEIDTRKKQGLRKTDVLRKIDALQERLATYPELSRTLSVVDALKWSRQATFGGEPSAYKLPGQDEMPAIASFSKRAGKGQANPMRNLVDSLNQRARITGYTRDVGSIRLPRLVHSIEREVDSIFGEGSVKPRLKFRDKNGNVMAYTHDSTVVADSLAPTAQAARVTGSTRIVMKANQYLIENLYYSLVATFLLIGIQMWMLFNSWRIMAISMAVNLIPLAFTAGLMGYLGIALKPSTALIYELAFGIAIDNSIHYLAAYRLSRKRGLGVNEAVSHTLRETGVSIIYTSVVLFGGFGIFLLSAFGSTKSLGLLTSITLAVAMFSNLLLMPLMLRHFDPAGKLTDKAMIDEEETEPASQV